MRKETYLFRLSRAARWRLPPGEAEMVIADYTELIEEDTRSDAERYQAFGPPEQAVRQLCSFRSYGKWLMVFGVLTACLISPLIRMGGGLCGVSFLRWPRILQLTPLWLGWGLSFGWFQRTGIQSGPSIPGKLWKSMLALAAATICEGLFLWYLASVVVGEPRQAELAWLYGSVGRIAAWMLLGLCLLSAALGLWGLFMARLEDRRWRALYVLALTVSMESLCAYLLLTSMDLDVVTWGTGAFFAYFALPALLGLAGTGVSLC